MIRRSFSRLLPFEEDARRWILFVADDDASPGAESVGADSYSAEDKT